MPEDVGRASFTVFGTSGSLVISNDAETAEIWEADSPNGPKAIELPTREEGWPEGPSAVLDLVEAVRNGGTTACDLDEARRATELGFAIHTSHAADGARIDLPVADRSLRVESFPWGNE